MLLLLRDIYFSSLIFLFYCLSLRFLEVRDIIRFEHQSLCTLVLILLAPQRSGVAWICYCADIPWLCYWLWSRLALLLALESPGYVYLGYVIVLILLAPQRSGVAVFTLAPPARPIGAHTETQTQYWAQSTRFFRFVRSAPVCDLPFRPI